MTDEEVRTKTVNWKAEGLRWVIHQGPATVMLSVLVWMIYEIASYSMTTAIPSHLRTIQEGYDRQQAVYERTLSDLRISHEKTLLEQRKDFLDALSRIEAKVSR